MYERDKNKRLILCKLTAGLREGAVHLTIWQPTDKEAVENWWVEKLDEWNSAHPGIQVSREAIDRSDSYAYDNKIATAVTSKQLPDILFVDGPQVSYYAANKVTIPRPGVQIVHVHTALPEHLLVVVEGHGGLGGGDGVELPVIGTLGDGGPGKIGGIREVGVWDLSAGSPAELKMYNMERIP